MNKKDMLKNSELVPIYKHKTGHEYQFALDAWDKHDKMVWHFDEVPLEKDVKDFKSASIEEQKFITNVMKLFTQNEIMVGAGYDALCRAIKNPDILYMLRSFNDRESTHVRAYSLFTETIGLDDSVYTDFLKEPLMASKTEFLQKAKIKKFEDYLKEGLSLEEVDFAYRSDLAKMIAVYAGGTELISLFAQFAMLIKFQSLNKYPGLCTIVEWSIKDEYTHGLSNTKLFKEFISENKNIWNDELKRDISNAIDEIVHYEIQLVDYFKPPHMNPEDCKDYIYYMADNALEGLGIERRYGVDTNPLTYMDEFTGLVLQDFFTGVVTEYGNTILGSREDMR